MRNSGCIDDNCTVFLVTNSHKTAKTENLHRIQYSLKKTTKFNGDIVFISKTSQQYHKVINRFLNRVSFIVNLNQGKA